MKRQIKNCGSILAVS
uniref:Uncharacterized protein n=1 Tax=Arundo donax TaxID=35708 RepID=A0A0A9BDF4_ARUDO